MSLLFLASMAAVAFVVEVVADMVGVCVFDLQSHSGSRLHWGAEERIMQKKGNKGNAER